jgi:hypothetical protein
MRSADEIEDYESMVSDSISVKDFEAKRHTQFEKVVKEALERFDKKNTQYGDAFIEGNESLKDAFESLGSAYGQVSAIVRMSDISFDKEVANKKFMDLLIYSALMMIWIDERR